MMAFLRKIVLSFIVALIPLAILYSQQEDLPVFKQVTHPFMPPITSAYFFFSEDGLIWFSTARGLTSFDGSEVTYYTSLQQTNSFQLSRIFAMTEDKSHNFYLGTPTGLCYYNRKARSLTNIPYTFSDNHKQSNIGFDALYCDNEGIIYAGSALNGLFVYDPFHKKLDHLNLNASKPDSWSSRRLNTVSSFAMHSTDNNKLWVGTFHGIYLFDKKKKTFEQRFEVINPGHYLPAGAALEHYDIQKMEAENDSIIWFNCWNYGFGKYNTHTGKVKLFLHDARVKTPERYIGYIIPKFARLSPGKYLIGIYDYKTALFDSQTEEVKYFTVTKNNYSQEQTSYATNDREGNVWLLQRGLLYISVPDHIQLQTVKIPTHDTISLPQLRGVYFDKKTNLFYGSFLYGSGVYVFDTNFHLVKIIPVPVINNYYTYYTGIANNITKDGSDRYWTVGPENYTLPPGGKQFLPVEKTFPSLSWMKTKGEFTDVITTKDGGLLYKKNGSIVYRIKHLTLQTDTIKTPVIKSEGVEIKQSSQWYDAKRNFIYLIKSNGIARHNLDDNHTTIIPNQSLMGNLPPNSGDCVFALDGDGDIWFMIPKYGIRIINPETLICKDSIPYGTKGLARGDYTDINGAEKPYMLLRSQNGVVVYDYSKQQSYLFDHDNGLSSPDNESLHYCNGYMLIAEQGSFEYFKLSNLKNYSVTLKPRLHTIHADTSLVYLNSGNDTATVVRLRHNQNSISFSFSAQEFIFPERIEYAYLLTPLDNDWHYTNYFNRKITFSKLAPGKYVFRLKAQMQGENWDTKPVEYTIIIIPAWWQTILFKICSALFIIGLFFYFNHKRIQGIRKKEQQKTKHEKELMELEAKALRAQMNPHFIFNSLNSIKSLINKNESDKAAGYLTIFSKLIRTLFQNSDKREVSLFEELETCKLYTQLEKMRFGDKVEFLFDVNESIDLKDIKVPALILQPFIENAIWHGLVPKESGGKVTVSVKENNGSVECTIDDDGIGRELSSQYKAQYESTHQSKGIGLTQSRLELDKLLNEREDSIQIIDKINKVGIPEGTKVIIIFKEYEQ
jgi:anti-sigma regulatory factor (Ser/Thr protein kinase)